MKVLRGRAFAILGAIGLSLAVSLSAWNVSAGDALDLRPHLAVGESVSLVNKTVTTIDMMGMNQKIELSMYLTATGREGGGLSVVYDRVKADFTMPMVGNISFDSDSTADTAAGNPVADALSNGFRAFVGTKIDVEYGEDGKVQIKNADAIDAKIKSAVPATPMGGQADTTTYKQGLDFLAPMLPGSAVKKGESWTASKEQQMQGMTLAFTSENTLEEISGDAYTVSSTGTLELHVPDAPTGDDPQAKMLAMMMKDANAETIEIKTTGRYSRRDGLVIDSTSNAVFKINMNIPGQGAMTMAISTAGTVERIK